LKNSENGLPQKFDEVNLCAKIGVQCHRNPATAVACNFNGNFFVPPHPFSIVEPTVLQILAYCRKLSFSTVSLKFAHGGFGWIAVVPTLWLQ
jgi:hypothetical protein